MACFACFLVGNCGKQISSSQPLRIVPPVVLETVSSGICGPQTFTTCNATSNGGRLDLAGRVPICAFHVLKKALPFAPSRLLVLVASCLASQSGSNWQWCHCQLAMTSSLVTSDGTSKLADDAKQYSGDKC